MHEHKSYTETKWPENREYQGTVSAQYNIIIQYILQKILKHVSVTPS